jgi:hypothetical protein
MKKLLLMKTVLLLFALVVGSGSVWADTYTLQLSSSKKFTASGLTDGSISWSATNNSASIGNWNSSDYKGQQFGTSSTKGNVVLSTSSITGTITQVDIYSQTGTSGGATVAVSVGGTSFGSQNMKVPTATGEDPGELSFTGSKTGTVAITLTQTKKKAMYLNKIVITYTPSSTQSSGASFETSTPSISWPTALTYTQTASTASGYSTTAGASVTYSIGSTNTAEATINASTGEVTPTKGGSVQVVATAAAIEGHFTQSSASYTLTVNDVRETPTLTWSENSVDIFKDAASYTLPTLNNPNSLEVTYSVTGTDGLASVTPAGVVTVNTGTVGTATVKATFEGNSTYKARTASYTINVVDPTVKGSKYNPYTVAEVIGQATATTFGDGIYVTGYIIGCADGSTSKCYKTTTASLVNTNFLIAATPDLSFTEGAAISSVSGVVPVELPSGTIRTNWGVASNNVIGYKVLLKGNAKEYFSTNGIKGTSEITAVSVPVTPGHAKITYVTPQKMDFSEVSGLKAYVATDAASSGVTMTRVETVPENTPLLLIGTAGTTYNVPVAASATAPATNYLVAGTGAENWATIGGYNYILYSDGLFYQVTSGTIATTKAYLHLTSDPTAGGARSLDIVFDDNETTGVNEVKTQKATGEYFNLAGQRVAQPTKGLYIVNGKKVIIK